MPKTISVTISQIDGDQAQLMLADGTTVAWPVAQLPQDAALGSTLRIDVENGKGSQAQAREVLNALLEDSPK